MSAIGTALARETVTTNSKPATPATSAAKVEIDARVYRAGKFTFTRILPALLPAILAAIAGWNVHVRDTVTRDLKFQQLESQVNKLAITSVSSDVDLERKASVDRRLTMIERDVHDIHEYLLEGRHAPRRPEVEGD